MAIASYHTYAEGSGVWYSWPRTSHARMLFKADEYNTPIDFRATSRPDQEYFYHGLNESGTFQAVGRDGSVWLRSNWGSQPVLNKWYSVVAVHRTGANRQVYVDGESGPVETGGDCKAFVELRISGSSTAGQCTDHAIWNVELTQREMEQLAAGCDPRMIRPKNLIWFWNTRAAAHGERLFEMRQRLAPPGTNVNYYPDQPNLFSAARRQPHTMLGNPSRKVRTKYMARGMVIGE